MNCSTLWTFIGPSVISSASTTAAGVGSAGCDSEMRRTIFGRSTGGSSTRSKAASTGTIGSSPMPRSTSGKQSRAAKPRARCISIRSGYSCQGPLFVHSPAFFALPIENVAVLERLLSVRQNVTTAIVSSFCRSAVTRNSRRWSPTM
jgi:hypothetical protein